MQVKAQVPRDRRRSSAPANFRRSRALRFTPGFALTDSLRVRTDISTVRETDVAPGPTVAATSLDSGQAGAVLRLQRENAMLLARLESAEFSTAQTLARATRLGQVMSMLGQGGSFDTLVGRAAVEIAELFSADIALLVIGPDDACRVEGQSGIREADVPVGPIALGGLERLTSAEPVMIGAAREVALPGWLAGYGAEHAAWARLLVGDRSLGLMLLVRCGPEPFERSDERELRAIAYRIALALGNGLLDRGMRDQLARLHRIQALTTQLAATHELEPVGNCVAEMLVSEVPVATSVVLIDRDGELVPLARCASAYGALSDDWERFPLGTPGAPIGRVDVTGAPPAGSEERKLLTHLLGLAALALDKALLYDHSREQARRDSLTGLLGHRVFHEQLEERTARQEPFSIVLVDIDDFKQVNDVYGHQAGDDALRFVADSLRKGLRDEDRVFRIGGEEFCLVLPGVTQEEAYDLAERLRVRLVVTDMPLQLTVSLGVAAFPAHARGRDELFTRADAALYASKRAGKNRTTVASAQQARPEAADAERQAHLAALLPRGDQETIVHGNQVATLAVAIARALDVSDSRLADLRAAAQHHDVGKIGVPAEILAKPGPLGEDEFQIVKTHSTVGAELLRASGLTRAARFVLQHHENIDGSGYPAGLRGDEITLEARIIRVADAFVAMTLGRPYHPAMDVHEASEELLRHSGTAFDPAVVDALLSRPDRRRRSGSDFASVPAAPVAAIPSAPPPLGTPAVR